MGLKDAFFDEVKKQFIARPDDSKNLALYKWPNSNIRIASQVTVQPDEFAYFVKKGEIVGYLPNGQYNLDGADIPFIGRLIDKGTDGNFLMSEIYFVSTRDFASNRFGGTMGQITDPDTSLAIAMGMHGEFAFEVFDAGRLIMNLVGTQGIESNEGLVAALREQILKHARAILNGKLRAEQWDVTRLTDGSLNVEYEPAIIAAVNEAVDGYGLRVTRLQDFATTITDESWVAYREITQRRANLGLAKDPAWMTMAQGEAMLGAAKGLSKGGLGGNAGALAGAGIGAGLGLGMGQQMAQGLAGAGSGAAQKVVVACSNCGAHNPEGTKFCGECGTPLTRTCPKCGAAVSAKFCGECGAKIE